jgi:ferric-dicitrate binding protein FerR (iron transport regulator)
MNYQHFSAEDFIQDEGFVAWVKQPDAATNAYWEKFLSTYPSQIEVVREAKEFVALMNFKDSSIDDAAMIKMKSQIDLALLDPATVPDQKRQGFLQTKWFRVAAAILLIAITGSTLLFIREEHTYANYSEKAFSNNNNQIYIAVKGKRSVIALEDGTRVWLNSDSRIAYNKDFGKGNTREVFLDGEAFFDVTEDKKRPFVVNTTALSVKVLGTAFNVRSFKDDATIKATLVRGKIALSTGADQEDILLLPNQQAVYLKDSKQVILENKIEAQDYTSWKSGKLYFKDETFQTIKQDLERWYDVEINVESKEAMNCRFSAKIDNMGLVEVMELFKTSNPSFDYHIEGRKVSITGNFCDQ